MLCKYRDIFGKVKTNAHSYRIFNIAIVDLVLTILVGILIGYYFKINMILSCIILILLGIIMHRIFCVNTTLNMILFGFV